MNTPARFESLLWMASPMAAWAQGGPPVEALANPEPAMPSDSAAEYSGENLQDG
jgi:hypothetical protein